MLRFPTLLAILSVALVTAGSAQQITVEGNSGHPAVTRLREVIATGYRVFDRDTVIPAASSVVGNVVIASADVRLEGSVSGSVVVLPGGSFFMRPGGRVEGSVVALGGGVYLTENGTVGEELIELPASVGTELVRSDGEFTLRLFPPPRPPFLTPTGFFGVGNPSYDRVSGVSVRAGVVVRPFPDSVAPTLELSGSYHQARSDFGGRAAVRYVAARRVLFLAEAARRTATNDGWIRGDLANSLAAIIRKSDVRNYFEEDLAAFEVRRLSAESLEVGESFVAPRIRIEASRARSLASQSPWALFGDEWSENPAIDEGDIASATAGAGFGWRGLTAAFAGDGSVEFAPSGIADFDFAQAELSGEWDMLVLWNHTLNLRGRLVHPLGTTPPRQRWYAMGGPGTIPTLEAGEHWGDHLAFLETSYLIPIPVTLPFAGSPSFLIHHAIGSAWTGEEGRPPLDQNVGVGVVFPLGGATFDIDPSDTSETEISFSLSLPFQ